GHRDQPLGSGGQVRPRGAAAPRVRAGSAVREDPSRKHQPFLVFGPELGKTGQRLIVEEAWRRFELGLDVGLGRVGPDKRRVSAAAEQQADRLGEDRFAGARLAGDRAEPRGEGEIRLPDEDQVLDPKAPEHWAGCYAERPRTATGSNGRRRARSLARRARAPGWVGVRDGTRQTRTRACRLCANFA